MAHGEAAAWQRRLRSTFDDPRLMVRWNSEIERFQIGYQCRSGAADHTEWFYTVTDGQSGFRPLDDRIVRKLYTLDKAHQPNWTPKRYREFLEHERQDADEKRRSELRYEMLHELKFARGRFWNVSPSK
jgi:hypothetical protein